MKPDKPLTYCNNEHEHNFPKPVRSYERVKKEFEIAEGVMEETVENCKSLPSTVEEGAQALDNLTNNSFAESISDQMKDNFRKILQENAKGFKVSKLTSLYKEKFGCTLQIQDLGFNSLKELVLSLPNIFTFEKTKFSQDWILFDARISPKRKDSSSKWIPNYVIDNIADLASKHPHGIKPKDCLKLYQEEYRTKIDLKKLGFESICSFLVNCSSIQVKLIGDECLIFPKSQLIQQINFEQTNSENALPSVEDMKCIWMKYFSKDVCDPTYIYKKYPLDIQIKQMRVQVSDVHSPSAIWLQPLETTSRLSTLMLNLNLFYDSNEEQYIAHENIIKPGLICCVKFYLDNKWYRSQIIEMGENSLVKICYVDFGTVNYEKKSCIRLLHKMFIDEPILVLRGKLHNIIPLNGSSGWSNDFNQYLFEELYQNIFFAEIMVVEKEEPSIEVVLIDTRKEIDIKINDLLIENNFAACSAISNSDVTENDMEFDKQEYPKVMGNLLPSWISDDCLNSSSFEQLLREIQKYVGNNLNHELHLCCCSHFIKSMFLTDPVGISNIWRTVLMKNITFLHQEFLKEASNIVKLEERFFSLQPFCENFSTELLDNTLLSKKTDLQHQKPAASVSSVAKPITNHQLLEILKKTFSGRVLSQENGRHLVFEADTEAGLRIIFIHVDQIYVIREQVIYDFIHGIPTVIIDHRIKQFIKQPRNLIITPDNYEDIFGTVNGKRWAENKEELVLMPLNDVAEFLKIIAPQLTESPLLFYNYDQHLIEKIRDLNKDTST